MQALTVLAPVRHNLLGSPGRSDDVCIQRQDERESKPKLPCLLMAVLLCFYGSCKLRQVQIPKTPLLCRRNGGRFQRGLHITIVGGCTEDITAIISRDLRFWKGKVNRSRPCSQELSTVSAQDPVGKVSGVTSEAQKIPKKTRYRRKRGAPLYMAKSSWEVKSELPTCCASSRSKAVCLHLDRDSHAPGPRSPSPRLSRSSIGS